MSAGLRKLGQLDDALEKINKALEYEPECALYLYHRALVFEKLKRAQDAVNDLRKAARLDAKYAVMLQNFKTRYVIEGSDPA